MESLLQYVLITPARNEARYIELTLQSMVRQTWKPLKWVIVSDGSTDGTDEIVARYQTENPWIELIRMPDRAERHFAGKVYAFNAGTARVVNLPYAVIGNLDADVSFDEDYFAFLMHQFAANALLGVAGTAFREGKEQYDYRFTNIEHVSGQIQLFRRECFEQIGGYQARKIGGIDWVAVTTARMKGWPTRTFTEKLFIHHRTMSSAMHSGLGLTFRGGQKDYLLGSHPLWELFRCIYQTSRPPIFIGGALRLLGFIWCLSRRIEIEVPQDLVRFRRREEMRRLANTFTLRPFLKSSSHEPRADITC